MPNKQLLFDYFDSRPWDDLVSWAGSKGRGRGREYQRVNRVKDLAVTEWPLASVVVSESYAVQSRSVWARCWNI
jgi:uncharacterized Zn finger protein